MVKLLDPEGVASRTQQLQRYRGQYVVPGPNFIWLVDGYLKLVNYGIEIYAAIDAYSRYIIWCYVGISARTSVSVCRQYLDTVTSLGYIPQAIRSDRGTETIMCANAHYQLCLNIEDNARTNIRFEDCYFYGTSTSNQRIEAW